MPEATTCFSEDLAWSEKDAPTDMEAIRLMVPGCDRVERCRKRLDKRGGDFAAYLSDGSRLFVDAKGVKKGAKKKWWKGGPPHMALERWNVAPEDGRAGVIGWTLDDAKISDFILQRYHPDDFTRCFLFPAKALRRTFKEYRARWEKEYGLKTSDTDGEYYTRYIYVPVPVVLYAMAGGVSSCVYPGTERNGAEAPGE